MTKYHLRRWVEKSKRYVLPTPDGTLGESSQAVRVAVLHKDGCWRAALGEVTDKEEEN